MAELKSALALQQLSRRNFLQTHPLAGWQRQVLPIAGLVVLLRWVVNFWFLAAERSSLPVFFHDTEPWYGWLLGLTALVLGPLASLTLVEGGLESRRLRLSPLTLVQRLFLSAAEYFLHPLVLALMGLRLILTGWQFVTGAGQPLGDLLTFGVCLLAGWSLAHGLRAWRPAVKAAGDLLAIAVAVLAVSNLQFYWRDGQSLISAFGQTTPLATWPPLRLWLLPTGASLGILAWVMGRLPNLRWRRSGPPASHHGSKRPRFSLWQREIRLEQTSGKGLLAFGLSLGLTFLIGQEGLPIGLALAGGLALLLPGGSLLSAWARSEGAGWPRLRQTPVEWSSYLQRRVVVYLISRAVISLPWVVALGLRQPDWALSVSVASLAGLLAAAGLLVVWGTGALSTGAPAATDLPAKAGWLALIILQANLLPLGTEVSGPAVIAAATAAGLFFLTPRLSRQVKL